MCAEKYKFNKHAKGVPATSADYNAKFTVEVPDWLAAFWWLIIIYWWCTKFKIWLWLWLTLIMTYFDYDLIWYMYDYLFVD